MQFSIVPYSDVFKNYDFRIDAEYYHPEFIKNDKLLKEKKNIKLESEYVDVQFGKTPKGANFLNSGIPFIRSKNCNSNFIDESDIVYITKNEHISQLKSGIAMKDVLVAAVGATIGQIAFSAISEGNINQNIAKIRVKSDIINPEFLFVFLKSKFGQYQLGKLNTGNARDYLNSFNISFLRCAVLNQQYQIKTKILIEQSQEFSKNSKSIYSEAEQLLLSELKLEDWKPKHELSFVNNFSNTQKIKRMDAEYFQPKYTKIIDAIKSYSGSYDVLGNLAKIKKSVEPGSQAYQDEGIPFVRVSNLSKFGIFNNSQKYISEFLYKSLQTYQPKEGEILLSKDATPGIAYHLDKTPDKMVVSSGILRLKTNTEKLIPEYLTLVLNSIIGQSQIEADAAGSVIKHWRPDQVKATLIPILSMEKQNLIKDYMKQSFDSRHLSKRLIEIATEGVEKAIEQNESVAEQWIRSETEKLGISL